ncbi:hypothetical protein JOC34_000644 [Virgibacillus halotolerans]|uniref:hypothetical protein n=1 Tax=Virgibacillus halotolerans TaxID=1071053 RepID=UPI001960AF7A|nr:hypothetical protein [Virgibacillus halotolerans]MBM7598287.1 hypothetical protein [Virgibacillus halotolerans]
MRKEDLLRKNYKQVAYKGRGEDVDTVYKRFDNGNMRIVQYDKEIIGGGFREAFLNKDQVSQIFI